MRRVVHFAYSFMSKTMILPASCWQPAPDLASLFHMALPYHFFGISLIGVDSSNCPSRFKSPSTDESAKISIDFQRSRRRRT